MLGPHVEKELTQLGSVIAPEIRGEEAEENSIDSEATSGAHVALTSRADSTHRPIISASSANRARPAAVRV